MYTVRLEIQTARYDERYFDKCFVFACRLKNSLVRHLNHQLSLLMADEMFCTARIEYGQKYAGKDKNKLFPAENKDRQRLVNIMANCERKYGITKSKLEQQIRDMRRHYANYLSAHQGQRIADDTWNGVQKLLFSDGIKLHFRRALDFDTIGQKDAVNGIKLLDWSHVRYLKHTFRLKKPVNNDYLTEIMSRPQIIKQCSLKRIEFNSGYKYYVIVTIDGVPPCRKKRTVQNNTAGIDLGTSTVAVESDNLIMLENLAPLSTGYEKKIKHMQKLVSRKVRLANPENFNSEGTAKKGKHIWHISKAAKRLRRQIRVLYRKQTAYIHQSHRQQIDRILNNCSKIIIEPMQFRKLVKKTRGKAERSDKVSAVKKKDGTVQKVHKYKRKRRFGHSIRNRSPGFFQSELIRKAELRRIPVFQIKTKEFKASQLDHSTGEYTKQTLDTRYKEIDGQTVQRDLYSAFLIRHAVSEEYPNFEACNHDFPAFVNKMNQLLEEMKAGGISNKACWGF